jgi:hypothetical protein
MSKVAALKEALEQITLEWNSSPDFIIEGSVINTPAGRSYQLTLNDNTGNNHPAQSLCAFKAEESGYIYNKNSDIRINFIDVEMISALANERIRALGFSRPPYAIETAYKKDFNCKLLQFKAKQ